MAFDSHVADRVRAVLDRRNDVVEKRMFGGLAFMVAGHMCCGVIEDRLMARIGPDQYAEALALPYVREMDFTGRPMTGFVYVDEPGFRSEKDLEQWVARCELFIATLSPKQ